MASVSLQNTINTTPSPTSNPLTITDLLNDAIVLINPTVKPPFSSIRKLFDHLRSNPNDASALNNAYPKRGIFKSAAIKNGLSDQKFTIDLSPTRDSLIPESIRSTLAPHGMEDILAFFNNTVDTHVSSILSSLSKIAGADFSPSHSKLNMNFRLCDYNPMTADPTSTNGCGEHTDYGTFSIIFQDGTPGLEVEAPYAPGTWVQIPGDATVVLAGWCALILSGGRVCAVRHRVRRIPGVRRLSAVLFVAPDLEVKLKPLREVGDVVFSKEIMEGGIDVEWFKDVMGKRWRWREGNLELAKGEDERVVQDEEIKKLIFGC
ncbi:hypothetical protein TWF718_011053 [Orbilia javanica]|uniref:Fe2OG dioxygenase domain-containing protein n=1 Tax=Orbilia javanica TaxID=47235 RepID=A0AAN8MNA0_9PEZI